jgi:hypothetical protein
MTWRFNPINSLRNIRIFLVGGGKDAGDRLMSGAHKSLVDPDAPAAVPTGTDSYYRDRYIDFVKRNHGVQPPYYYLDFGEKYMQRFMALDTEHLSADALSWRDRTRVALQEAMEAKRREDPKAFAVLERDPEAFKAFAYGTHADAYVNSGLFDLCAQDIAVIATTPDIGDILTSDGLKGWRDTIRKLRVHDVVDIGRATVAEALD